MFGIGFGELIIIFVVALLVVGPQKMPEMAKKLARILREVRKTSDEFQASFLRDSGAEVKGFLNNPQERVKRHLESEVNDVLAQVGQPQEEVSTPLNGEANESSEADLGETAVNPIAENNSNVETVKRGALVDEEPVSVPQLKDDTEKVKPIG